MKKLLVLGILSAMYAACGGSRPAPSGGGEDVICPNGTANAGRTIRTVNCTTVVQYDGSDIEASVDVPGLVQAGMKNAEKVLREVNAAATDAQIQFTQTCELYNGCNLTSDEYRARLDQAQAHFRAIREKVALLEASQGNPAVLRNAFTELYATTVPADVRAQNELGVEFIVQAKRAGSSAAEVLRGGEHLRTGDQVVFGVRVSQSAHVYLFQKKAPSGKIEVLFPNPSINGVSNPIAPGQLARIPPQGAVFTLDDKDLGKEDVFLAVSRNALPDLESALARTASGQSQDPGQVEKAMVDLFAEGVPECRDTTRGLQVTSDDGCGTLTRGLTPTPSDDGGFFGEQSSVRAQTLPGDDVILRVFSFHHEG